jgi:hypothetical protein
MSDRLSICSPKALCVFVMRATRPSRLSSTMAQKTPSTALLEARRSSPSPPT